jgi:hypothetical protein
MKKNQLLGLIIIALIFVRCAKDYPSKATYKVDFCLNWNNNDFPTDYPSNAHFSKLIGWSHQSENDFFAIGTIASNGIKDMAELGDNSTLENELNNNIKDGKGLDFIIGENLNKGVGTISFNIDVNKENPSVTLATMLAPSPDWYVAVVDVNLFENESFIKEKTINGLIYDAGTDSGKTFKSSNDKTIPKEPISLKTSSPLASGGTLCTVTFTKK